jgi:IS30 family transposase
VERSTRFLLLLNLDHNDAPTVALTLADGIQRLPEELRKTLTLDRGLEMAAHKSFTIATNVSVYFCDPRSPWQRGSNENTNGLLRQYLPKGSDLKPYTQDELDTIAKRLNTRPRKTLAYRTPGDMLENAIVALTP